MKSSLHNLIPFLPFLLNHLRLPTLSILFSAATANSRTRLNSSSVQFSLLPSSYPGRLASRNSTKWKTTFFVLFINPRHEPRGKQPLYCWEGVFTEPLRSNRSYSIVCVFVTAGMCLPSSCLAICISSDFIIPAFGRHVTLFSKREMQELRPWYTWTKIMCIKMISTFT
jgi:hypothetical protein